MRPGITRRQWLAGSAAAAAAAGWLSDRPLRADQLGSGTYQVFFGDLHNHNSVGYAKGSLERTFEIARNHLDFFAFTPHGWWPDIMRIRGTVYRSTSRSLNSVY